MAGIPYRSKMQPHWPAIKSMRESGSTWKEIVAHLATAGVETQPSGVHRYYKRMTRPEKKGLGLPGWGTPAQAHAEQRPEQKQQAGEGSKVPGEEVDDFDFTPMKESDPFAALEKALKGKQAGGANKDSPEKS